MMNAILVLAVNLEEAGKLKAQGLEYKSFNERFAMSFLTNQHQANRLCSAPAI